MASDRPVSKSFLILKQGLELNKQIGNLRLKNLQRLYDRRPIVDVISLTNCCCTCTDAGTAMFPCASALVANSWTV